MRIAALILFVPFAAHADTPPAPGPAPAPPPAASTTATAEPGKPWTFAVAPRIAFAIATSKLGPAAQVGVELDVALSRRLVLAIDVSLDRPSHDGTVMDTRLPPPGTATYTVSETELAIALDVGYRIGDKSIVPWVAGGPLIQMLRTTETNSIAPGENTAQSTKLGIDLAGGVDFKAGPGYAVGQLRIDYAGLDDALTGSSNAGRITIGAAYRLTF
jgi:hypothetical protein